MFLILLRYKKHLSEVDRFVNVETVENSNSVQ
jgi:hypothetical protein